MSKRIGEISVDWESPERKRLRSEQEAAHLAWTQHTPEDKRCVDQLSALLETAHSESLPRSMDSAIMLIQGLKWLQAQNTAYSLQSFELLYSRALDYIGKVIDQINKVHRGGNHDDDTESILGSFTSAYQYLIELIAKHNECADDGLIQNVTDQEFALLMLPVGIDLHSKSDSGKAARGIPLPQCVPKAGSQMLRTLAQSNLGVSFAAVVMTENTYTDQNMPWIVKALAVYISKESPLQMRIAAWSLLPIFSLCASRQGRDVFCLVAKESRITVDDPMQLMAVVARSVGAVACARSGSLRIGSKCRLKRGIGEAQDALQRPAASLFLSLFEGTLSDASISRLTQLYSCSICDHSEAAADAGSQSGPSQASTPPEATKLRAVSLSDWLPYWFIASSKHHESISIQFIQNVCRFVRHAPAEDINFMPSALGQATIRRLSSSNREIRLAAKDAILAFSKQLPQDSAALSEAKRINRIETMRFLSAYALDLREPSVIEETLELLAGGIGCACA
ncbi:hypothetical protein GGI12_004067, partial [Dipsacomyces acuminosporus]